MLAAAFLCCAFALAGILHRQSRFGLRNLIAHTPPSADSDNSKHRVSCEKIAESVSSASRVYYPASQEFDSGISHWVNSSSQIPACSVEPGTPRDVALILQEIDRARVPFAIKGGGHTANPGFSSTVGIHISMTRFRDIFLHEDSMTVDIGAGLTWTDVYDYLVPKGLNVVGGRLNGIGVAGLTLGGGYSWKTNQYGLTVDTVTEYELVLPSGEVKKVTEQDEDLWFALKGGFNNYVNSQLGIVTRFTLKLHLQTDVWSASLNLQGDLVDQSRTALAKFLAQKHDHRAAQMIHFVYSNGSVSLAMALFYDGPEPPAGLYDELLDLTCTTKSIVKGTFTDFVSRQFISTCKRGYFHGVPILSYTKPILEAFANETKFWGDRLSQNDSSLLIINSLAPFESDFLTHGGPSAHPPNRSLAVLPSTIHHCWTDESVDHLMADSMRLSAAALREAAISERQDLTNAAPYVNYALFGTPLEAMYAANLERLRAIRRRYDPGKVMGLAGGWKL